MYLLEAMASGVPVVQPDARGFTEVVNLTGGGLLYRPNEPAALADALARVLAQPETLRRLGRQGRQAVRERFSMEAMARRMCMVYEQLR